MLQTRFKPFYAPIWTDKCSKTKARKQWPKMQNQLKNRHSKGRSQNWTNMREKVHTPQERTDVTMCETERFEWFLGFRFLGLRKRKMTEWVQRERRRSQRWTHGSPPPSLFLVTSSAGVVHRGRLSWFYFRFWSLACASHSQSLSMCPS